MARTGEGETMICFLLMIAVLGIYIYHNNYHNKRDDYRCPLCHGRGPHGIRWVSVL